MSKRTFPITWNGKQNNANPIVKLCDLEVEIEALQSIILEQDAKIEELENNIGKLELIRDDLLTELRNIKCEMMGMTVDIKELKMVQEKLAEYDLALWPAVIKED